MWAPLSKFWNSVSLFNCKVKKISNVLISAGYIDCIHVSTLRKPYLDWSYVFRSNSWIPVDSSEDFESKIPDTSDIRHLRCKLVKDSLFFSKSFLLWSLSLSLSNDGTLALFFAILIYDVQKTPEVRHDLVSGSVKCVNRFWLRVAIEIYFSVKRKSKAFWRYHFRFNLSSFVTLK